MPDANDTVSYTHDALGRRIVRKQGTNKEVLLWWGNTEQSEHKHQAGQTTIQNDLQANPSEQALNTIFARALEGDKQDIQYFHKNYLAHVMAVSDDNGNLLEHYRYAAFGEPEIYNSTGTKLAATSIDNDILWNVRRYESANGLYMYLYRDYDAPSGRWPSRDPIKEKGGINLYGFARNNGMKFVDILGSIPEMTAELRTFEPPSPPPSPSPSIWDNLPGAYPDDGEYQDWLDENLPSKVEGWKSSVKNHVTSNIDCDENNETVAAYVANEGMGWPLYEAALATPEITITWTNNDCDWSYTTTLTASNTFGPSSDAALQGKENVWMEDFLNEFYDGESTDLGSWEVSDSGSCGNNSN